MLAQVFEIFLFDFMQGKDSVIECVRNSGTLRTYQSYNLPGDTNQRLKSEVRCVLYNYSVQLYVIMIDGQLPGFEPSALHYINGYIYCRVQHPMTFNNNGENFDLNKPNYLLMATGTARSGKKLIKQEHLHLLQINLNFIQ